MVGSVQALTFSQRQLQVQMTAEAPPVADSTVHAALSPVGLSASREGRVWTLTALAEPAEPDASQEDSDE